MYKNEGSLTDEILLEGLFTLYPQKKAATVQLTNSCIEIKNSNISTCIISLKDVVGCLTDENKTTSSINQFITIFYYPMKKKLFSKPMRYRCFRMLGIISNKEDKKVIATLWKRTIKLLLTGKSLIKRDVQLLKEDVTEIKKRNFLVYVNPFSGNGKALKMYNQNLLKMMTEAEISHICIKTAYQNHAHEDIIRQNLNKFDAIVVVSGDGLIHEIINGLMKRPDRDEVLKIPIGIVPGGSGNALASAIVYNSFMSHPLPELTKYTCAFDVVRGRPTDIDLMTVNVLQKNQDSDLSAGEKSPQHETKFAILGFVHGIIADVDIESEKLRKLGGGLRNTIYGVWRTMNLRHYHVQLSYLPLGGGEEWVELEETGFIGVQALVLSHVGQNELITPRTSLKAQHNIHVSLIRNSISKYHLVEVWDQMGAKKGLDFDDPDLLFVECRRLRVSPLKEEKMGIMTVDGEVLEVEHGEQVELGISDTCAKVLAVQ